MHCRSKLFCFFDLLVWSGQTCKKNPKQTAETFAVAFICYPLGFYPRA